MPGQNHILFISSWYPNRNHPTHGIFNKAFAKAAALYNKVSVLHVCSDETLSTPFELVETTEENITTVIVYYKKIQSRLPLISQLQKRKQLLRGFESGYQKLLAKTGRPDLIQLNVAMPAGIGVLFLSKKYGIPFVMNEGWSGYCPADGSYQGAALKYFTKKITAAAKIIMPVSPDLRDCMLAHSLRGHYTIVPNVVDTELFAPKALPGTATTKFIHISTLDDSQKNVSGILRAFGTAVAMQPGMELCIVGDGENRRALEALAATLGLQTKVSFTGRLMGPALADKVNASDALVMFSNYETFCLTVAEALACGKPVITSKAGGLTNHINSELGMTVAAKDETALSACLLRFKNSRQQFNPAAMRQFIVSHYTPEKIGRQLTEVYNAVLLNKPTH